MADVVKQVIIINPHTKYSNGRMMAQCAHASILSLLSRGEYQGNTFCISAIDDDTLYWMKKSFVKIVYKAKSLEEIKEIKKEASAQGIPTYDMIEDDGMLTAMSFKPVKESSLVFLKKFSLRLA